MTAETRIHRDVQDYYGKVLRTKADLQTTACCPTEAVPAALRPLLANIDDEIHARSYGCGSPIPDGLEGCTVLDLGCGTGRDVYLAAQLVGESGRVIGLDMTAEQLEVARRHEDAHRRRFGYAKSNVEFRQGYLEDLAGAGIEPGSVDVVISNCVLNLAPDKERVFAEIRRALKPGGEVYFADVFVDRRLPAWMKTDPVLVGECLGGAMYTEDFRRMLLRMGIADARVVARAPIAPANPEIEARIGDARFSSMTVRFFALDTLEDRCEDYGEVATYLGTLPHAPECFVLDDHHVFVTGEPMAVCSNTADMLMKTRFGRHFRVEGDRAIHRGLFDCGPAADCGETPSGACC